MPYGKPGDHPYSDRTNHGTYYFPPPIDELMKRARRLYPELPDIIGADRLLKWHSPEHIAEAKEFLEELIHRNESKAS